MESFCTQNKRWQTQSTDQQASLLTVYSECEVYQETLTLNAC